MKITKVSVFELEGPERSGLAKFETFHPYGSQAATYRHRFTEIHTDEGITGLSYGGSAEVKAIGETLIGEDPTRTEYIWEHLYSETYWRLERHRSIAILDLALWDINGKMRGEPVYRLLGGPCQQQITAYAAMLGFASTPEQAAERSVEWVEKGFTALKWYLPHGAPEGEQGIRKNVALIKAVREAVGPDVQLMVDCGIMLPGHNSLQHLIRLARRLEPYDISWLEEPLNYDDLDAYAHLARATTIPIAAGERIYTRWHFKQLMDSGAITIVQPDPIAAMGLTEVRRIIALASAYGLTVVSHTNESTLNTLHLLFANPLRTCPMAEWGVKLNQDAQYFFKEMYKPVNGSFQLPNGPGFGYEIDMAKVVRRTEI